MTTRVNIISRKKALLKYYVIYNFGLADNFVVFESLIVMNFIFRYRCLILFSLVVVAALLIRHGFISQDNQLETSQVLYFGHMSYTVPIAYIAESDGALSGYCKSLLEYLKDTKNYNIEPVPVEYKYRFTGTIKHKQKKIQLGVECGPNTINNERKESLRTLKINGEDYPGYFSKPFFRTETKLLLKKEQEDKNFLKLYRQKDLFKQSPDTNLKKRKILVGGKTNNEVGKDTNNQILKSFYPNAELREFDSRKELWDILMTEPEVIAFAGDEILLVEFLKDKEDDYPDKIKNYTIVPILSKGAILPEGITSHKQDYGIVYYKKNFPKIEKDISDWLKSSQGIKAKEKLCRLVSEYSKNEEFFRSCLKSP